MGMLRQALSAAQRAAAGATALVVASALLVGLPSAAQGADNAPPVAAPDSAAMYSGSRAVVDVLANDTDPEAGPLTLTAAVLTSGAGSVSVGSGGVVVRSADGYRGPLQVTYTVIDASGAPSQGLLTVDVVGPRPNAAPIARTDSVRVRAGVTYRIAVLRNDRDPDGHRIRLVKVGKAAHGRATRDGAKVRYRARPFFTGTEVVTYRIRDSKGATATGTLKLRVRGRTPSRVKVESTLARLGLPGGYVDGRYTAETARAVCAWRTVVGRPAHRGMPSAAEARAIVSMGSLPRARASMVTGVNVSQTCQAAFWVGAGRSYIRVMAASTGMKGYRTRIGTFRIFRAYQTWRWSTLYPEARMYKPLQFSGGMAIHGSETDALVKTYPASHGCVRVPHADINALHARGVGVGDLVRVFGSWARGAA